MRSENGMKNYIGATCLPRRARKQALRKKDRCESDMCDAVLQQDRRRGRLHYTRCYSERRATRNSVYGSAIIYARPLISANKVRAITDMELRHRDQDSEEGASLQRPHPCAMHAPPVPPPTPPPYPFCCRDHIHAPCAHRLLSQTPFHPTHFARALHGMAKAAHV